MVEKAEDQIACLRVWLEEPSLHVSYERHGIVIMTVTLRREAALAASKKLDEILLGYEAVGDPDDGLVTLREFETMVREVLGGGPGQVMPLTTDDVSPFDAILGRPS